MRQPALKTLLNYQYDRESRSRSKKKQDDRREDKRPEGKELLVCNFCSAKLVPSSIKDHEIDSIPENSDITATIAERGF